MDVFWEIQRLAPARFSRCYAALRQVLTSENVGPVVFVDLNQQPICEAELGGEYPAKVTIIEDGLSQGSGAPVFLPHLVRIREAPASNVPTE